MRFLKRARWSRQNIKPVSIAWASPKVDKLYRVHYARDPFVSKYHADWALATVCPEDVSHYASISHESDSLPNGYAYFTTFKATLATMYTGDFKHEQGMELASNRFVSVRLPLLMAVHVARLNMSSKSNISDSNEMDWEDRRRWLYEARVERGSNPIVSTQIIRCAEAAEFLEVTDIPHEFETRVARRPIVADVDLKWTYHQQMGSDLGELETSYKAITTPEEYDSVVRSKVFQMSPFEALVRTVILGFGRKEHVDRFTDELRTRGLAVALDELKSLGESGSVLDYVATYSIPRLSSEIHKCIQRFERGLDTSPVGMDGAIADLIEWAWGLDVTPKSWWDLNCGLERATGETLDRIFSGEIVRRGILGQGYQRMIFRAL